MNKGKWFAHLSVANSTVLQISHLMDQLMQDFKAQSHKVMVLRVEMLTMAITDRFGK